MSSGSEKQYSIEELKKLNQPPETEVTPSPSCPTEKQWTHLVNILNAQYRLLESQAETMERMRYTMGSMATQLEKLTKEIVAMRWLLEQAGKKKERRLSLPEWELPRPNLAWLWVIPILVGLWVLWYASATIWNALQNLTQQLP